MNAAVADARALPTGTFFVALGGLNVLVLRLRDRRSWRAGKLQMAIDQAILLAASPWLDAGQPGLAV